MDEPAEQYAYFTLYGDFDPAEITARVGTLPTKCWRQGDVCPRRRVPYKVSRWSLHSRLGREQELEAHVADVLDQLEVQPVAFAAASRDYSGTMNLVGYFHREYPGLYFEGGLVERLARFHLGMDFDFYGPYSQERDDA